MPSETVRLLRQRLTDALLTTDGAQRLRLAQAALAMLLMALSIAILVYAADVAGTPPAAVWAWAMVSFGGLGLSYLAIRSGWSRRLADPALTRPQMLFSIVSGAWGYALTGPLRGATFPVLLVILMFGMFQLRPRAVAEISLFAAASFGGVMLLMSRAQPEVYRPAVELGHFMMLAAALPAVALLASRLARLRERSQNQRRELAEAVSRIQQLATRDELTGLINRRHMVELLEQERQRSVRSGHGFCVALLDIDHFKQINDRFGHGAGDAVLKRFASEAGVPIRAVDVLARWGGEEFVILLSGARLPLARLGIERVRQRIEGLQLLDDQPDLHITVSAGLAEHIAGESIGQTLERADRALYDAKATGRNRTVIAGHAAERNAGPTGPGP